MEILSDFDLETDLPYLLPPPLQIRSDRQSFSCLHRQHEADVFALQLIKPLRSYHQVHLS